MTEPLLKVKEENLEISPESLATESSKNQRNHDGIDPSPPLNIKPALTPFPTYKTPASRVLSKSIVPPTANSGTSTSARIYPLFSSNRRHDSFVPSDVSLISQPLITTPTSMQLSTLLQTESDGSYRQGFTPRAIPTHGSATTNGSSTAAFSSNKTPRPFPIGYPSSTSTGRSLYHTPGFPLSASAGRSLHRTPGLPLSASTTSSGRSHASFKSSLGFRNQGRTARVRFAFTPVIHAAPSQHFPRPSPIFPLSSHQTAALGYSHVPTTKNNTPLHPFARHAEKSIETLTKVHKKRSRSRKARKPVARIHQVDVSGVMTMDTTTRPCRCPKNRCVKLYCECFQRGQICDPNECICKKCLNTAEESGPTGVRTKSVALILTRKQGPEAFVVKPKKTGVGCSCKKSRCLKKYCDCVQLGRFCNPDQCICKNCQNLLEPIDSDDETTIKENVSPTTETISKLPNRDVKLLVNLRNAHVETTQDA